MAETARRVRRGTRTGLALTAVVASAMAIAAVPASGADENLAEFYGQQLDWHQCEETPTPPPSEQPDGSIDIDPYKGQWKFLECATARVPLDYADPGAGTLDIEVSRFTAKEPGRRKGVVVFNPGGPGGGGLSMPLGARETELANHFDLIGFDPRGSGRSTKLLCERVQQQRPDTTRPTDEQFAEFAAYARAREDACERAGGGMRPFINTANTARDMDVIRAALGEKKINYVGYSYGTYLGAVYGSLFPGGLNRSVLDSSIHPDWLWREQGLRQSVGVRFNVEQWAAWTAERDDVYHLGTSKAAVLDATEKLAAELADRSVPFDRERPGDWPAVWPDEFDRSTLDMFLAQATRPRQVWDVTAEVIAEVRKAAQDGSRRTALSADAGAAVGRLAEEGIPEVDEGVYDTVTCEADWPSDLDAYYDDMREYREKYPYHDGNGSGVVGAAPTNCTFRSFTPPEKLVELKRDGYPTGVVIQGDGDPATQYAGGPAMSDKLGDQLISVRDSGSHGHYGTNECVTERVDDYLIDGVLPPSRSECTAEPRPDVPADDEPGSAAKDRPEQDKEARVTATLSGSFWR